MTPTQPSQAVEAAEHNLRTVIRRAHTNIAFSSEINDAMASLRLAIRAELARPQEVAAPVVDDGSEGSSCVDLLRDEIAALAESAGIAPMLAWPFARAVLKLASSCVRNAAMHSNEEVKAICAAARVAYLPPDEDPDGYPGGFDMTSLDDMRRVIAASRLPVASPAEPVPLSGDLVIKALLAMDAEARKRGEMFPQTADEQERDTKAVRNVIESLEFYTTGNQCRNGRPSVKNWPNLPATPPVGAGGAGVMDARPDSVHSDSGECDRVQGPGPTDAINYKGMWLAAVSTLAKIDALLGLPEDGCNDPDMTLSALQDYMAGIKDIVGSSAFTIEDVRGWIAQGQARALALDPYAAILASKGGDQGEGK